MEGAPARVHENESLPYRFLPRMLFLKNQSEQVSEATGTWANFKP